MVASAVATDKTGHREAASVRNALLSDDGERRAILDQLGAVENVEQGQ
jgi:hypothetical protein